MEESLLLLSDLQKLINHVVLIDYTIIILGGELDGSIWKCQCKICSMQVCGTASQCGRLYSGAEKGTAMFRYYQD